MSRVLPILFNTDMVRAILDERKTVTRRVVKPQPEHNGCLWKLGGCMWSDRISVIHPMPGHSLWNRMPYQPGDYIYVRETWKIVDHLDKLSLKFEYEADGKISDFIDFTSDRLQKFLKYISKKGWCPALFMPKEAARIWLKVTDVRVERLRDITEEQAKAEGAKQCYEQIDQLENRLVTYIAEDDKGYYALGFKNLWNSTLKKSGLSLYGWDANPWVWVIEFERCEKPER